MKANVWRENSATAEPEVVVPVFGRRAESADGGMKLDQALGHSVAGGISVEAAEDGQAQREQDGEPGRVGSGAGGGEAAEGRMKDVATEGVDGRLAEDDGVSGGGGHREAAMIFAGAWSHAAPGRRGGAAQFGADGGGWGVAQQEDRIGPCVRVDDPRVNERLEQRARQSPLFDEVTFNAGPVVQGWRRERQHPGCRAEGGFD